MLNRLPMEVWARVASFLPFDSLIETFWTLRRAGVLPYTHTPPSNALLQFCSEVRNVEEDAWVAALTTIDADTHGALRDMGFSSVQIDRAVHLCNGNIDAILEYLLHMTM